MYDGCVEMIPSLTWNFTSNERPATLTRRVTAVATAADIHTRHQITGHVGMHNLSLDFSNSSYVGKSWELLVLQLVLPDSSASKW